MIHLEEYDSKFVLRDDLLLGGTKSIFMPFIQEKGITEYVYASPVFGGFQLALSHYFKEQATIFVAKRNIMHPNQLEVKANGSKVVEVPFGYLSNIQAKARQYCEKKAHCKLIEWGGASYINLIAKRMREVLKKTGPLNEVWCAVGSGTLVQGILAAVPPSTKVYGVQVGADYTGIHPTNLTLLKYPKPFAFESQLEVPFSSNANYDRKALEYFLQHTTLSKNKNKSKGKTTKTLFWNVY